MGSCPINLFYMDNEAVIRLGFFFGVLFIMCVWEILSPRRKLTASKTVRWFSNLGIVFLNTVILRLIFPAAAIGMAVTAEQRSWGLLNNLEVPPLLSIVAAVIFLDFVIYIQHVLFHAVPLFWRLHRMHHADLDYDVTTGSRFHPIEIILSMLIKMGAITVIGAEPVSVLIFEVMLSATAMFNHGNVGLPPKLDRVVRMLIVTPDMHRVHHSIEDDEANSNFGFSLSVWDRFLGTYKEEPRDGHEGMTIGIRQFRDHKFLALPMLLAIPFMDEPGGYSINRRKW